MYPQTVAMKAVIKIEVRMRMSKVEEENTTNLNTISLSQDKSAAPFKGGDGLELLREVHFCFSAFLLF